MQPLQPSLTRPLRLAILAAAAVLTPSLGTAQTCGLWRDLGDFGGPRAFASSATPTAHVIVGAAMTPFGAYRAFRWTESSGIQDLGTLGGGESRAYGVSADGNVVVGWSLDPWNEDRAFRWTPTTGMQDLGALPGCMRAMANAVSADGDVVVGWSDAGHWNSARAFRWTQVTGMQSLGTLPGDVSSHAFALSADGSVVVGISSTPTQNKAFRWSAGEGMRDLVGLSGFPQHEASGVSADGNVVIGDSSFGPMDRNRAFRWTEARGVEPLEADSGLTIAFGISADGRIVVGWDAFRWTATTGMERLDALGVSGTVFDISDDGRVAVGAVYDEAGYNRAFRLQLSEVGATYCGPAVANSTGCGGRIFVEGSAVAAANDLSLVARFLPLASFGYFLASRTPDSAHPVHLTEGRLCVGGAVGRFRAPGQIQNSGSNGAFELQVDLSALPSPTGFVAAQPGETWYFQAWHRDANPTTTSNFTDAVRVRFE